MNELLVAFYCIVNTWKPSFNMNIWEDRHTNAPVWVIPCIKNNAVLPERPVSNGLSLSAAGGTPEGAAPPGLPAAEFGPPGSASAEAVEPGEDSAGPGVAAP